MSIYKRGRLWWCKITAPGHETVRESSGTADRTAAQEFHDRRAAELWRVRRLGERARTALADAIADWIETHAKHKRSFESDRLRLAVMLPELPGFLDELTTAEMTAIRDRMRGARELSAGGVNKYLAILSAVLHHAHRRAWIDAVPHVPTLPVEKKRFTVLTPESAGRLLEELPAHLAAMARFALSTGLRDANVRGLQWSEVDLAQRVAWVWPDDAKAGRAIGVPLSDDAISVLQGELGKHATHVFTYAVVDKHGKELRREPIGKRTNNTGWRKARERAGLPGLRVHDLRHAWATWHAQAGTPLMALQALGGWSTPAMVQIYAHLAGQNMHGYANAIRIPGHSPGHSRKKKSGVADGIRTHNNWNHNPGLYR